jgi:hypothetical protein
MGLQTGDPQRRPCQSEECLDLLLRPRRKIDGMNIPGANGFCGAEPGRAKCFSPRMNTNIICGLVYCLAAIFLLLFVKIRVHSWRKFFFLNLYKHFVPPGSGSDWR